MTVVTPNSPIVPNSNNRGGSNAVTFPKGMDYTPFHELVYDPQNSFHAGPKENELDIFELAKIIFKRKFLILSLSILGAIAGLFYGLQQTPKYKSGATIEIQKQESQIIGGSGVEPVNIADAEFMKTQYELLKSRSLAERTVLVLGLERDAAFANQMSSRNERMQQASAAVIRNISVAPVGRSRIIQVSYVNSDAGMASSIPNAIIDNFIESTLERKFNTTAYARNFLKERLAQAKASLEKAERGLVKYADANDILELSDSGDQSSLVSANLVRLSEEYSQAQSERIKTEQAYRALQGGTATEETLGSADLLRLRAVKSGLSAEYQDLLGTFKPAYPKMVKLAARIEAIDLEIEQEREAISQASDGAYRAALAREQILKAKVDASKGELRSLRTRRIDYTILRREVDTARSQYDALLQRLKEVSIASGVGSSQISIVDRAQRPKFPFSPNIPLILTIGTFLGLATGLGLALLLYFIDNTIKTPDDIKEKLKLPAIGVIPLLKIKGDSKDDLIIKALANPRSNISEAYFSARTSLEYATDTGVPKSLLVTSTQPAEGKSSTSIALAISFAKLGRKVLIIDADLRKPSFIADTDKSHGLSGLLTKQRALKDNIMFSDVYGLHLLPSGVIPPNPAELLSGRRLQAIINEAEDMFDIVIVDSPPVLNFTDGPVLGSACEAAIIVYKSGNIRTPAAKKTIERLKDNNVNVIGAVLTHFDAKKTGYDYNYYYYAYGEGASKYGKDQNSKLESARRKIRLFSDEPSE